MHTYARYYCLKYKKTQLFCLRSFYYSRSNLIIIFVHKKIQKQEV